MKILSCIFVIIGVIIGAGFASGKEIYTFFFNYGIYGIIGYILSAILLGYIVYKTLKIIKKYEINNYDEFLDTIIGKLQTKNINIKIILDFIINIFLLITFFIMCAGFAAYFKQELGINEIVSSIIVSAFCLFILSKNIKGIFLLNSVLMPMIIIVLCILGVKAFDVNLDIEESYRGGMWFFNAILYASYNSITLISILIPMKKYIKNKKDILKIAITCCLIILALSTVIFILLLSIDINIGKIELPTVYAAKSFGIIYKYLYGVIILGAISTTAISSAYGFLNNVSKTRKKYNIYNNIICFIAIFVSLFGFSNLINNLYPIFGILGLIQLIFIIKCK